MRIAIIAALSALLLSGCATRLSELRGPATQVPQRFTQTLKQPVKLDYLLSLPADYSRDQKWPLVLFLHGMGERGSALEKVTVHGPPKLVKEGKRFPFILVSPQCPDGDFWHADQLVALLDDVARRYSVDSARVYVTGLSMGGYGTWDLIGQYPERFAAAAPICGGGDQIAVAAADAKRVAHLKALPIWAFHGAKDTVVPLSQSEDMIRVFKWRGAETKLTVYPEAGHDSWTETYNNPEFYDWLLSHRRSL